MGHYPKHLKQRRHRRAMRTIAMAALAGCTFVSPGLFGQRIRAVRAWYIRYPDGSESHAFASKGGAARRYLYWHQRYRHGLTSIAAGPVGVMR